MTGTGTSNAWVIGAIAALSVLGVIAQPFRWPEWIWAVAGAVALVALQSITPATAWSGLQQGLNVLLFLTGMMLLSEVGRQEGLFDWLASRAVTQARGSATRLFTIVYAVGILVTVLLSNDATAVVLTPAVAAAARAARVRSSLPYLFICAFVANAASFVLPISNPANLVVYGAHLPPLAAWVHQFSLPSAVAIGMTYAVLRWTQRAELAASIEPSIDCAPLSAAGRLAAVGLIGAAIVLLTASALGWPLGGPTLAAAVAAVTCVLLRAQRGPGALLRGVAWGVLPLVAGLFVIVAALEQTGVAGTIAEALGSWSKRSVTWTAAAAGIAVAIGSNLVNNLPAGLLAGRVLEQADLPEAIRAAALIGVDLGPNLSVTGSLATILWLGALRREGIDITPGRFLRLGTIVMIPALLLAIGAALLV